MNNWLSRLEYKFRRFGIDNLMLYITGTMLAVYVAENITRLPVSSLLTLDRALLFRGQIWRLVTFIFVPPNNMILWVLLMLYFYYFIGNALENTWGRTRFTIFYLFGMLGAVIAALITGYGDNTYLNLSMFLAFAALYPDHQVLLFFVIPVKVKILAYINIAMLALSFLVSSAAGRAAIVASLLNVILFFGDDFIDKIRDYKKYGKQRRNYRKAIRRNKDMYGN